MFVQPHRWIVIVNDLKDIPIKLNILVDSQFYAITKKAFDAYAIHTVYKLARNSNSFIILNIAMWTASSKFKWVYHLNIARDRKNLMKINLNFSIVITNTDSLNHLEDYRYLTVFNMCTIV